MIETAKQVLLAHPQLLAATASVVCVRSGARVWWARKDERFVVRKGDSDVLLARRHGAYVPDLMKNFEMMTEGIHPVVRNGRRVYDFTAPAMHDLADGTRWSFPGLPEVDATSDHYIEMLGVGPGHVVWDIGAYSGRSTKAFADAVGETGRVIAVEADPGCFACLCENLGPVDFPTVELVNAALWADDGTVEFQAEANQGSTVASASRRDSNVIEVQALTPESLFKQTECDRVDAVKIDIEGAEYSVVPAFASLLGSVRPAFVLEVHKDVDGKINVDKLIDFFRAQDYDAYAISQPEQSPFPLLLAKPR